MCFKIPWDYSDDDNLFAKWKQVKLLKFFKTIFMHILINEAYCKVLRPFPFPLTNNFAV